MSRVLLVFLPGLSQRLLREEALPWLASVRDPRHVSELVPPFPCLPDVVIHSALCGQSPAVHGRVLSRDTVDSSIHAPSVAEFAPQLRVRVDGRLLEHARAEGLDSLARSTVAAELDDELRALFESREDGELLLLAGVACARAATERIQWERLPHANAGEVAVESAILRFRCAQAARRDEVREALLRLRGVERVLEGEALEVLGVRSENGGQLLALAREGFSFEEERASVGSLVCRPQEEGILLGLCCRTPGAWPSKLHALRLAPSLAAYLERATAGYADRPFAL